MKIYLAGPMTGYPEHNYPAFHAAAARIRARGHICINPAEINPDTQSLGTAAPDPHEWSDCLRRDIPHLLTCEGLALLPYWPKSNGTRLELTIAAALGMAIFLEADWTLLPYGVLKRLAIAELLAPAPELPKLQSVS